MVGFKAEDGFRNEARSSSKLLPGTMLKISRSPKVQKPSRREASGNPLRQNAKSIIASALLLRCVARRREGITWR